MSFIKILCVGLMVCDLLIKPVTRETLSADSAKAEAIRMLVGGDAFNVASNLSALGTETTLYSAVGEDASVLCAGLRGKVRRLHAMDQNDGRSYLGNGGIDPSDGERSFVVQRGASTS